MKALYRYAQLEATGTPARANVEGISHRGWIVEKESFVYNGGTEQHVLPLAAVTDVREVSADEDSHDRDKLHAVIRFNREIQFPRFSMSKGERWSFVLFRKTVHNLKAIEAGERFDFAGGQCLAEDVEILYVGPANIEYSRACGYVR